jgi:HAD superfamily hydrolase (TIGR01509 family)
MYKSYIEGKKAVLFDLDGTIVDTHDLYMQAFSKVLSNIGEVGAVTEEELEAGTSEEKKWKSILNQNDFKNARKIPTNELVKQTYSIFMQLFLESERDAKDGFWETLSYLKNQAKMKVGLTTNTRREITDQILKKLGLDTAFDLVICGDEVKREKPHPEMYAKALKTLGLTAQEVLVFEDSIVGFTAAKKAGIEQIIIWDGKIHRDAYRGGAILNFMEDFMPLVGNLDKTYAESLQETLKDM